MADSEKLRAVMSIPEQAQKHKALKWFSEKTAERTNERTTYEWRRKTNERFAKGNDDDNDDVNGWIWARGDRTLLSFVGPVAIE